MRTTRREFLYGVTAAAVFPPTSTTEPDLVLYNGHFITVDSKQSRAQAVAISNGRFLAVGANQDIRHLVTARTRQLDLGGKTVTPGFIDAHTHPAYSGNRHLKQVDCDLRSIGDIQKALRDRATQVPAGKWVLGFKYDDTKTAEGRPLLREDLDAVTTAHPVFVEHRGGHTAFVNSAALEMAGINEQTPDPPGGQIQRDSAGRPTGNLKETAVDLVTKLAA